MQRALLWLDDRIQGVLPAPALIGTVAALGFCVLDHPAPWARLLMAATLVVLAAATALRGWRMDSFWRPGIGVMLLLTGAVLNLALPTQNDVVMGTVFWAALVAPVTIGYWLWYKICLTRDWWPADRLEPEPTSAAGEA